MLLLSKKLLIPDDTICSKILLRTEVNEIGLYFSKRSLGPFLCKANILAKRQSVGTSPEAKDLLNN